jgi:hypothetical protein
LTKKTEGKEDKGTGWGVSTKFMKGCVQGVLKMRTEEAVEIYERTEETGRKGRGEGKIPVAVTVKPELDRQEIVLIPWQNATLKQDNIFVFF